MSKAATKQESAPPPVADPAKIYTRQVTITIAGKRIHRQGEPTSDEPGPKELDYFISYAFNNELTTRTLPQEFYETIHHKLEMSDEPTSTTNLRRTLAFEIRTRPKGSLPMQPQQQPAGQPQQKAAKKPGSASANRPVASPAATDQHPQDHLLAQVRLSLVPLLMGETRIEKSVNIPQFEGPVQFMVTIDDKLLSRELTKALNPVCIHIISLHDMPLLKTSKVKDNDIKCKNIYTSFKYFGEAFKSEELPPIPTATASIGPTTTVSKIPVDYFSVFFVRGERKKFRDIFEQNPLVIEIHDRDPANEATQIVHYGTATISLKPLVLGQREIRTNAQILPYKRSVNSEQVDESIIAGKYMECNSSVKVRITIGEPIPLVEESGEPITCAVFSFNYSNVALLQKIVTGIATINKEDMPRAESSLSQFTQALAPQQAASAPTAPTDPVTSAPTPAAQPATTTATSTAQPAQTKSQSPVKTAPGPNKSRTGAEPTPVVAAPAPQAPAIEEEGNAPKNLTGFEVSDGEYRIFVVEGGVSSMKQFMRAFEESDISSTLLNKDDNEHIIYNPQFVWNTRMYHTFKGTNIKRIRMKERLSEIIKQQNIYLEKQGLKKTLLESLLKLHEIVTSAKFMRQVRGEDGHLLPSTDMLAQIEKHYGQLLTSVDLQGTPSTVSQKKTADGGTEEPEPKKDAEEHVEEEEITSVLELQKHLGRPILFEGELASDITLITEDPNTAPDEEVTVDGLNTAIGSTCPTQRTARSTTRSKPVPPNDQLEGTKIWMYIPKLKGHILLLFPRGREVPVKLVTYIISGTIFCIENASVARTSEEGSLKNSEQRTIIGVYVDHWQEKAHSVVDCRNVEYDRAKRHDWRARANIDFMDRNKQKVKEISDANGPSEKSLRLKAYLETHPQDQEIYIYAGQKLNTSVLQQRELRQRIAADKHHNYTYNSNFGTLSVPRATDEEIELMQTVGRVSSLSKTGKSRTGSTIENRPPFIYPVPRRASEDHVHYKKPDDWRIADLAEPWEENQLTNIIAHNSDPLPRGQPEFRAPSSFGRLFTKDKEYFTATGMPTLDELQSSLRAELQNWRNKIVVDDVKFKVYSKSVGRKFVSQVDKKEGMLKDPPQKLSLRKHALEPLPHSMLMQEQFVAPEDRPYWLNLTTALTNKTALPCILGKSPKDTKTATTSTAAKKETIRSKPLSR